MTTCPAAMRVSFGLAIAVAAAMPSWAQTPVETPSLVPAVGQGALPAIQQRLPQPPSVVSLDGPGQSLGQHGGQMHMIMGSSKDVRMMVVYGYARLVGYTSDLQLRPDIAERVEVEDERRYTLHLRRGHRWSDGQPLTSADFKYYWDDVLNHPRLQPSGLPPEMLVDGERPTFEVLSETAVRYAWPSRNPGFLHALAGPRPLAIFGPAHYLKKFHAKHTPETELEAKVKEARVRNWMVLHNRADNQYQNDNPDLPTLQPWVLTTRPPADRFVFRRNPYYHRIDATGRQLPYVDEVVMLVADNKIVPLKTGAGESDLQARYLRFDNYTFLKEGEARNRYRVRLWKTARGADAALIPNLTVNDPTWRTLLRDVRFRRALSLAIDRHELNQVVFYGLGIVGNNTVLPASELFKLDYRLRWTRFDLKEANRLLDDIGLAKRNDQGIRLLSDGRPLHIVIETAGQTTEQTDILELIRDSWLKAGIKLYIKPMQIDVLRNRVFSGEAVMTIGFGIENGLVAVDSNPWEFAPTEQQQLQWSKWGQYFETKGRSGEAVDIAEAKELVDLKSAWRRGADRETRRRVWDRILEINADQLFTIGLVAGALQPVVVSDRLKNVPDQGLYNWDPGAHFGIHRPDTFWLADRMPELRASASQRR